MKKTFLMCLLGFVSFCFVSMAQSPASEELTISTYYPAPYGVYKELRNQRTAIGENYIDGSQYCWEGTCTTQFDSDADLIVEGNVGIGTENPKAKLDIKGEVKVGETGLNCNSSSAGTMRYHDNKMEYCDGSEWEKVGSGGYCYAQYVQGVPVAHYPWPGWTQDWDISADCTCPPNYSKPDLGGDEELGAYYYLAEPYGCLGGATQPVGVRALDPSQQCEILVGKACICCHN